MFVLVRVPCTYTKIVRRFLTLERSRNTAHISSWPETINKPLACFDELYGISGHKESSKTFQGYEVCHIFISTIWFPSMIWSTFLTSNMKIESYSRKLGLCRSHVGNWIAVPCDAGMITKSSPKGKVKIYNIHRSWRRINSIGKILGENSTTMYMTFDFILHV